MPITYRILVADDSEDIRELLNRVFTRQGHKCDVARNGVAAKNLMGMYKYDALITDLAMPQMHGHQLIQEVLAGDNPPVIIVITGVAEPRLIADIISRGVDDIMIKPLSPVLFAAKVIALIDRRKNSAAPTLGETDRSPEALAQQIQGARQSLEQQLSQMTRTFQTTISQLEQQQNDLEAGLVGSARLFSSLLGKLGGTGSSHAGRVETIAVKLGAMLALPAAEKRNLELAALLHDIGQFGMPDDFKSLPPWSLTLEQREEYEMYPGLGAALLGEVPGMQDVAAIIAAHAENYDGTGFPKKLKGADIPLASRIIRIADGCDLLYMQRKAERPIEDLRDHLNQEAGRLYDPSLAKLILPILTDLYRVLSAHAEMHPAYAVPDGYILAEDVFDKHGHFLARNGGVITPQLREHLMGILGDMPVHVRPPSEPKDEN